MLDLYAFYLLAPLIVISAALIFVQKRLVRAVVALTTTFIGTAILFFLLGQTLIAIIMLIVFVGGLSVYLIVAVATEEKNANLIILPSFAIVAVVLFAALTIILNYFPAQPGAASPSFLNSAAIAFQSDYPILYMLVILLFGITLAGAMVIKRFSKLVI